MLLPTRTFNKGTIIGTIDILQTIAIRLAHINEIVSNKVIMIWGDLLTVRNT